MSTNSTAGIPTSDKGMVLKTDASMAFRGASAWATRVLLPPPSTTRYPAGGSPASNSNAAEFLLSSFLLARHLATTVECYEKHAFRKHFK